MQALTAETVTGHAVAVGHAVGHAVAGHVTTGHATAGQDADVAALVHCAVVVAGHPVDVDIPELDAIDGVLYVCADTFVAAKSERATNTTKTAMMLFLI